MCPVPCGGRLEEYRIMQTILEGFWGVVFEVLTRFANTTLRHPRVTMGVAAWVTFSLALWAARR